MGCGSSVSGSTAVTGAPSEIPVHDLASLIPVDETDGRTIYIGAIENLQVLCRDEFNSKFTNELLYRWRPAEMIQVEGDERNKVLIHYSGWADTFDIWLDLKSDIGKISPMGLLTIEQYKCGDPLTPDQFVQSEGYFLYGKEIIPEQSDIQDKNIIETVLNNSNIEESTLPPVIAAATSKAEHETAAYPDLDPDAVFELPNKKLSEPKMPHVVAPVIATRRTSGSSASQQGNSAAVMDGGSSSAKKMAPPSLMRPPDSSNSNSSSKDIPTPPPLPPYSTPSNKPKKLLYDEQQHGSHHPGATVNPYCVHDMVDVLDIFYKKGANIPSQKWRPAKILEVVGAYVTIHYLNWDSKYDERLHTYNDAHRISEFGLHTTRGGSSSSVGSTGSAQNNSHRSSQGASHSSNLTQASLRSHTGSDLEHTSANHGTDNRAGLSNNISGQSSQMKPPPPRRPSTDGLGAERAVRRPSLQSNESSELDHPVVSTAAAAVVGTAAADPIKPSRDVAEESLPTTAASDVAAMTAEQYSFTRSFLLNHKTKNAETQGANSAPIASVSSDSAQENIPGVVPTSTAKRSMFRSLFGLRESQSGNSTPTPSVQAVSAEQGQQIGTTVATESGADGVAVAEAVPVEEEERDEEAIAAREQDFLEKLEAKGLHVFSIEGDGNCLFRAVSHQLYLHQDMHEELRACCVEHLIRHRRRFEVFVEGDFEEYIREMSKPGVWGDDLEIRALEEITDRVVTIYSSNVENVEEPINNNFEETSLLRGVPPLTLSYHGQSHYNSIYDERYPLPLEHRKTRLLLRSRTALNKQDILGIGPSARGRSSGYDSPDHPRGSKPWPVDSTPHRHHREYEYAQSPALAGTPSRYASSSGYYPVHGHGGYANSGHYDAHYAHSAAAYSPGPGSSAYPGSSGAYLQHQQLQQDPRLPDSSDFEREYDQHGAAQQLHYTNSRYIHSEHPPQQYGYAHSSSSGGYM